MQLNIYKKNKVSIIVPVYNREKFLDKCINSITNQSYKNIEILLIDDGSKDNSLNICKEYAKKDKRIVVIHKENGGVQSARNLGIEKSTGELITFIDADDYVENHYIQDFVDAYISNNEPDLVVSGYYKVDPNGKYIAKNDYLVNLDIPDDTEERLALYFERFACYCWNHLYKSEIIKKKNIKFDKDIVVYDDTAFTMNYVRFAKDVAFTNTRTYNYVCEHTESTVSKSLNKKRVNDTGSYEKLKTCVLIYNRYGDLYDCKSNNFYRVNINNRLSSVLYHISLVSMILYISSLNYDYRYDNETIQQKIDECYNFVKESHLENWHYDYNDIKTELPSVKYVKLMSLIFKNFPKFIFISICKLIGNQKIWNIRLAFRRGRLNK